MTIYLGADHRGFNLKERLKGLLKEDLYEAVDMGALQEVTEDDYPEYAAAVARKVAAAPDEFRGIVICGSGFGVDIVANKFKGVRAGLAMSPDHAYVGRHDDNLNVLALAADFTDEAMATKIVKVFLTTPFAREEKYSRRLDEISRIEESH